MSDTLTIRFANVASGSARLDEYAVVAGTSIGDFLAQQGVDFSPATTSITVRPNGAASSTVQPTSYALRAGDILQLSATAKSGG